MDGIVSDPSIHSPGDENGSGKWLASDAGGHKFTFQSNQRATDPCQSMECQVHVRSDSALPTYLILALEVPPQTIEQVQGLSLAINCPAAYHGLKIIICCREVQLEESPNCLSVSIRLLVFQHLIPHATLNDMTRTPVPEAKVQCRKDPWNTRRRVCQPS